MRVIAAFVLCVVAVGFSACSSGNAPAGMAPAERSSASPTSEAPSAPGTLTPAQASLKEGTIADAEASQVTARKIIRNGELDLESDDPLDGQRQLVTIAESSGGFVVTSESRQLDEKRVTVSATVRIPEAQFDKAVEAIRAVGARVLREKVTGQDVTEEFVDVQARIRTKKAVESQYLEIMKQAKTVPDVLAVQEKLGAIRSEIEQLEGRLRFLESQTSLSTIKVTLSPPTPVVAASGIGFFDEIRRALGNTIDVVLGIITGLVWFASYFIPFAIIIGIPGYFVLRFLWRRLTRAVKKPE
jgi:hypothetical protein